jgi:DNA processing protein
MTRLEACLLLNAIPNIGFFRAAKIVSHFGSAETVFENSVKEWRQVEGLGAGSCYALKQWKRYQSSVDKQIQILDTLRVKTLFYGDSTYPKPLSFCPDAPIVLFYKGNLDFNQRKLISIVGTRTNTLHGKAFCEKLIEALAPYQPIICSGLAKGIDIIAHRKALEQGLESVACLAHGLERIYPPQHVDTAQRLCKKGGLLTDFLPYAPFGRENFPKRNRLMAGMALATIVIESVVSGGGYEYSYFCTPLRKGAIRRSWTPHGSKKWRM